MSQPKLAGKKASSNLKPSSRNLQDVFGLNPDTMTASEKRSAISGYDLRYRIEAMVSGVSQKKIKHVYVGDGAATAPGIMFLPRIPGTSLFPMRHARVLLGYAAHEIAHQLKTNFQMLMDMFDDKNIPDLRKRQLKEFWNAIEDYRIEKLVRKEYPGFHSFIDDTRDHSARRFCESVEKGYFSAQDLANPYRLGSVALTWLGADINGYKTRAPLDALGYLESGHRAWIEGWRDDMAAVETCQDAFDLANRILDELDQMRGQDPEDQQEPENQQPQQQGNPSQQNPSAPGQGGNSQSEQGGAGAEPPEADEDQKSDPGDPTGENPSEPEAGEPSEGDPGAGDPEEGDQAGKGQEDGKESSAGEDKNEDGESTSDASGDAGEGSDQSDKNDAEKKDGESAEGGAPSKDGDKGENSESGSKSEDESQDQSAKSNAPSKSGVTPGDSSSASAGSEGEADTPSDGSSGKARPHLSVKDGDEQAEAEAADLEIEELIEAINSLMGEEAKTPQISDEKEMAGENLATPEAKIETVQRGQSEYNQIRKEVAASAARAAGVLRRMLQSQDRRSWRGGKEDGDLDFGRVVPMVNGSQEVYRARAQQVSVNSAISLLFDNSGSMTGEPLRMCQKTAVTLDMAVKGTKTNVEMVGFTSNQSGVVIYRYRAFGQKGGNAAASLGNMVHVELGGTPVSTPLLESWRRLCQQKEPRRIIIVVSDGGADYADRNAAREAHDFIVSQGCIVIGIAIGCENQMKEWCDNVQAIESFEDLPIALTNLVREAMK